VLLVALAHVEPKKEQNTAKTIPFRSQEELYTQRQLKREQKAAEILGKAEQLKRELNKETSI